MSYERKFLGVVAVAALVGAAGCSDRNQAEVNTQVDEAKDAIAEQVDDAGARLDQAKSDLVQAADDAAITARVKARLAESLVVGALQISVETESGVVTLSGTVANELERISAESTARSVTDVREVKNDLIIQS